MPARSSTEQARVQRLERIQALARQVAARRQQLVASGLVPTVDILSQELSLTPVSQTEAGLRHPDPAVRRQAERAFRRQEARSHQAFERMEDDLPPIVRRSMQQRLEPLVRLLVDAAERSYVETGKVYFPRSVVDEICRFYADQGQFSMTPDRIERMGMDAVKRLLADYARMKLAHDSSKNRPDRLPDLARTKEAS